MFWFEKFRRTEVGLQNYGNGIFVVCFAFSGRHWESCRKSANDFYYLNCGSNGNHNVSVGSLQWFCSYLPNQNVYCAHIIWVNNDCDLRQYLCVCVQLWTKIRRQRNLVWQMDTRNLPWAWFPGMCHRAEKFFPHPNDAKSPTSI